MEQGIYILGTLLARPDAFGELAAVLTANAGLPGPHANLTLATTFATAIAAAGGTDAHWKLLREWVAIAATDAPTGDPREYLPFCAIPALGVLSTTAHSAHRAEMAGVFRVPPATNAGASARWSPSRSTSWRASPAAPTAVRRTQAQRAFEP